LTSNSLVRARCCNMIGNLMRHNGQFYEALKKNKDIFTSIVRCCQSDELNVRKVKSLGLLYLI
jgi:hypothetical protein